MDRERGGGKGGEEQEEGTMHTADSLYYIIVPVNAAANT